jgi:hypothetical protein
MRFSTIFTATLATFVVAQEGPGPSDEISLGGPLQEPPQGPPPPGPPLPGPEGKSALVNYLVYESVLI